VLRHLDSPVYSLDISGQSAPNSWISDCLPYFRPSRFSRTLSTTDGRLEEWPARISRLSANSAAGNFGCGRSRPGKGGSARCMAIALIRYRGGGWTRLEPGWPSAGEAPRIVGTDDLRQMRLWALVLDTGAARVPPGRQLTGRCRPQFLRRDTDPPCSPPEPSGQFGWKGGHHPLSHLRPRF
jgi:hypothetical protein